MKTISFRKLETSLRSYDVHIDPSRGKGSHRLLVAYSADRRRLTYPVPYHGKKTLVPPKMQRRIIDRFDLPCDVFN